MKFMSILLSEGRKEDLKKKYLDKFKEYPDTLDFVLGISDLIDSNHKYTDFVLKNLHPNSSTDEVEDAVELVKDFDRYSSQFPKKDINQYVSLNELKSVVEFVRNKKLTKELEGQVNKIYEDDLFLVIKPKTEQASCKYGARTKWCVTSKGSGHFGRYTSGSQELYFIINKKNSTNENYSKVAVHVDNDGNFSYWDAQDNRMDNREIKVLEYAFPELMKSIKDDYNSGSSSRLNVFTKQVFDNYSSEEFAEVKNYLGSNITLEVFVEGFENVEDMDNHAVAKTSIQLHTDEKAELLDSYEIFIVYRTTDNKRIQTDIGFNGIDPSDSWDYVDLGLENFEIKTPFIMSQTPSETARGIRVYLAHRVLDQVKNNPDLINKVKGEGTFWRPNRASYGYTFGKNKGLIKKLVDYLDSGTIGTRLDFLESIGKLKTKVVDGKKLYSISGNNYEPSSRFRGQFSSFFASAKLAGILNYRKVGKDYFLTKGPNFEVFKSGELKAL